MSTTTLPSAMSAVIHNQKTQSLSFDTVPLPKPSKSQYLIRSHAVALTNGELLWPRPERLTISTPGCDFVATVVQSPSPTAKFQPGDKVYGRVQYPEAGAAREYTVTDDNEAALCPKNLSSSEAATVPMSALTAWQALFEKFDLKSPSSADQDNETKQQQRILITNASGGVGIFAVQLAKLVNLHVTATAGPQNVDFVRSLGADEVLNYRSINLKTWAEEALQARHFDFVLDCASRSALAQAWHAVKPGGQVLTIVPPDHMQWDWDLKRPDGVDKSIRARFFIMHPDGVQLGEITRLLEQGKLRAVVDSVYPLEDFQKTFEKMWGGGTRGKIVLRVDEE